MTVRQTIDSANIALKNDMSLSTSAKEVIQPRGWAKVGDYVSKSVVDSIRHGR